MRYTIAVQAALLVLEHPGEPYPALREILVYPATFRPRQFSWTPSADADDRSATLGESWQHGVVVLAWDAAHQGTADPSDGQNLVLHEFSHQLDPLDDEGDGVPTLPSHMAGGTWTAVMAEAFQRLNRDVDSGRNSVLDEYGASDPAEFFAVATEAFFEKPGRLQREHPALYGQLRAFYSQDPAAA
jgi:Mlc titration factor MtfA (ptsG expression regulator)